MPSYNNPLSPQLNPNRLSGGMMPSTNPMPSANTNNDVRSGLTRRFTTNALPSLSPIGQQRKQAAGDYSVSTCISLLGCGRQSEDLSRVMYRSAGEL